MIALHGCGGLYRGAGAAALSRRSGNSPNDMRIRPRRSSRRIRRAAPGQSRVGAGGPEVGTISAGERTIDPQRRRLDALGALRWLAAQQGVAASGSRSSAGRTAEARRSRRSMRRNPKSRRFAKRAPHRRFSAAAVAFYPGCTARSRNARWRPCGSVRILIGEADDWTPAAVMRGPREARAGERGWPLEVDRVSRERITGSIRRAERCGIAPTSRTA